MKFKIEGVDPNAKELQLFHQAWKRQTEQENTNLAGGLQRPLSSAQRLVIDLYCGQDSDERYAGGDHEIEIEAMYLAQMELEALFRGRQLALVEAFHRGEVA